MYQNERESGRKRIAFDKYDVGKVMLKLLSCCPNRTKGKAFQIAQELNIRNWAIIKQHLEYDKIRPATGKVCVSFIFWWTTYNHLALFVSIHIDGAHSLPAWTFPNITVKTDDRSYDDHHHQHHSQHFRWRHWYSGKHLHPFRGNETERKYPNIAVSDLWYEGKEKCQDLFKGVEGASAQTTYCLSDAYG